MPDEIRSIRIESNNICYGPEPGADDEVEQYLTISSTGRVWFSARNYQQYCNSKDYCRKKRKHSTTSTLSSYHTFETILLIS